MILPRTLTLDDDGLPGVAPRNISTTRPPPNNYNPTSGAGANGTEINVVVWVMAAVATCFLGARLCIKLRGHKGMWWDDHALVASWAMLLAYAGTTTYCVSVGLGSHGGSSNIDPSSLQLGVVISTIFSALGAAWSKTSFALTLLRITREGSRLVYWGIWFVIITMNLVLAFNAIIGFIWCDPPQAAWNSEINGNCWDRAVVVHYTVFGAAYSAAMDFMLAMVPWFVIMKLSMRKKEKLGVVLCMSLGIFAGCTSIMRAVTVPSLYSGDYTYEAGQLFIWTGAELATTIVAASIPILRVLLSDIVKSARKTVSELNTFKTLKDEAGIRVTHTTTITRSPSKRAVELEALEAPGFPTDTENLLDKELPMTPGPAYHSYIQKH